MTASRDAEDRAAAGDPGLRALSDPWVVARIREAEERVRNGDPATETMLADELGALIEDLRAGPRRPELEDPRA
jgi:hypothetical protein